MNRAQQLAYLNQALLADLPQLAGEVAALPGDEAAQRRLLRALMNLRPAELPLDPEFLTVQDAFLSAEREAKGVVDAAGLPDLPGHPGISLWQGDITRLKADAIVNAANSALLGCFHPCHGCIDNAIHSAAGLQLRAACHQLMAAQGHDEPTGQAKITAGYNLPAKYVLHTVGPVIRGAVTDGDRGLLASCYRSCLTLAEAHGIESVDFPSISTGVYGYPLAQAACVALKAIMDFLAEHELPRRVRMVCHTEGTAKVYRQTYNMWYAGDKSERL